MRRGYNDCAKAYDRSRHEKFEPSLEVLVAQIEPGRRTLDLGCGAGIPVTRELARHFDVSGVDASPNMIERARANVPGVAFSAVDMMSVDFPAGHFAAIVAFRSIHHLPRDEHPELFKRVHDWLEPRGYFLATLSRHNENSYLEDEFFGVTMFWSNFSLAEYLTLLEETGFEVLRVDQQQHPLVFAQKRS
ncbi:MAG: class I SAM-dependent methyltransferase [bacterium]|nr:class I SAM-dependent methyltransferase [bacterium]